MRTAAPRLRLALAGLFAVISLLQTPSMVFAWSGAVSPHHGVSIAAHVHQEPIQLSREHHAQDIADDAHDVPACHVIGCCTGLTPVASRAPAADYLLLGPLDAAPARKMVPALPDPADPPPRLQA